MKKKVVLYIATSLDGFIAKEDGSIDWLKPYDKIDFGYNDFLKEIGALIMGNKTYEQVKTFGEYPYKNIKSYVFTRNSKGNDENVEFFSGSVKELLDKINLENNEKIWLVGGGEIIDLFLKEDIIDEFILFFIPIILGEGIKLFKRKLGSSLKLKESKIFDEKIIKLVYERKKNI